MFENQEIESITEMIMREGKEMFAELNNRLKAFTVISEAGRKIMKELTPWNFFFHPIRSYKNEEALRKLGRAIDYLSDQISDLPEGSRKEYH